MSSGSSPLPAQAGSLVDLVWPVRTGIGRSVLLTLIGTAALVLSAKIQVPFWPVPMTLQTLAVLALGGLFGLRIAVASVVLYLLQGMAGLPVFANTPPEVAGPLYLLGPTGGFLVGYIVAAAITGFAADRGLARHPLAFAAAVLAADAVILAMGWLWLGLMAQLASGATGIGLAKAFSVGVEPFLRAEALKMALVVVATPALYGLASRFLGPKA